MTYTFARVGAVVALTVEDYFPQKKRWWLKLREKNGKLNEMPCHHNLEEYLDAYIEGASIAGDRKGPLFRSAIGKTGQLSLKPVSRGDVWRMVRRRASDAGIETAIRLPYFPRHRNNRLFEKRGTCRGRSTHGRPLERENHRPLRPSQG